jgi:hypothetical protein
MKYPRFLILIITLFIGCEEKHVIEDVEECDTMGSYYEGGEHYISREFMTEEGILDYNKQFEKSKFQNSKCNPASTF